MTKNNKDIIEMAKMFKAIGHPIRLAIFKLICNCDNKKMTVKNIYKKLKLNQPIVSHHLSIMRNSGILVRRQVASNTFYCLCESNSQMECIQVCFKK